MKRIVLVLFLTLLFSLFSCENAPSTDTETTDFESETEILTEKETAETFEIETEKLEAETQNEAPVTSPESKFRRVNGITYQLFDDYAEIYSLEKGKSSLLALPEIEGLRVKSIRDEALEFIEDKSDFVIYGYYKSFLYDYAVENEFTFFEIQDIDSTFHSPHHYYPDSTVPEKWMIHEVNVPITKIYSARNDDDEIDRLVSEYLLNGTGYDELFERVLHRLSCANRLAFMHDDGFEHYYISEDGRLDFSPYTIYCTYEHNSFGYYIASYERVKYCNIESYSEFVANAKRVFTEDYVNRSILGMYRDTPTVISCNDQIYTLWGGAGSPPLDDFNCKMLVAEDVILIHITCYEYYGGEKGLEYNLNYILTRFDEGWRFDSTNDMLQGYGQYLYNILVNQTQ